MFDIVLYRPEIPPNTGNIIRLCAATGATLHLIEPLGFRLDDRNLRRAGLDYHEFANVRRHATLGAWRAELGRRTVHVLSRHAEQSLYTVRFNPGDALLFGSETQGLPTAARAELPSANALRIPMREGIRSLNLANAVAITLYEALRQCCLANGTLDI
ncbi:MAG: tRNA (cytidine(34)-2'-O)-methyltransferase [Gammaproteobacteria bacterium]